MSHSLRRMPVAAEVNAFQRKVGRDQRVASRLQAQHGAVVSDCFDYLGAASAPTRVRLRHAANLGDQGFFRKRHGVTNISDSDGKDADRYGTIQNALPGRPARQSPFSGRENAITVIVPPWPPVTPLP